MGEPQDSGKKTRRIYWLCDATIEVHRLLGMRLNQLGYQVQFFSSLELLTAEMSRQRAPIIIVGDEGPIALVERAIKTLSSMPEGQGVRMLLSVSRNDPHLSYVAAACAFRDLIPLDLKEKFWLERFVYATARASVDLPTPYPQVSVNQIASVAVPARVVWMSERRLLIEARLHPPVGTAFTLSGKFVDAIGLKRITVTVEECRRTDLIYRFSDAIVARWNIPQTLADQAKDIFNKIRQTDFGPRVKVFLAIQDVELRNQMVRELDPLRFEVNIALQKQSIIDEPKFFCPHIVFIEDRLCMGEDINRFGQMLSNLSAEVPIYVIGNRAQIKLLQNVDPVRKVVQLLRIPPRLTDAIFTKYLPTNSRKNLHAEESAVNITPDHPFSMVELHCQARLLQAHPRYAQVAVPVNLGIFGLYRIEAPEFRHSIGAAPYVKVLECRESRLEETGNFPYVIGCYLSDVGWAQQQQLASTLNETIAVHFRDLFVAKPQAAVKQAIAATAVVDKVAVNDSANVESTAAEASAPAAKLRQIPERPANPPIATLPDDIAPVRNDFERLTESIAVAGGQIAVAVSKQLRNKTLINFVAFLAISTIALVVIFYMATMIANNWHRSGSQYTDQLKKFAPDKFENNP